MEIMDPDLWNDDGTPKKPSKQYMKNLEEAQLGASKEFDQSYLDYIRAKEELKAGTAPVVGDVVHAWDGKAGLCRAAIVMEVDRRTHHAEIRVHVPRQPFEDWYAIHVEGDARLEHEEGSWHWAEGG